MSGSIIAFPQHGQFRGIRINFPDRLDRTPEAIAEMDLGRGTVPGILDIPLDPDDHSHRKLRQNNLVAKALALAFDEDFRIAGIVS